MGHMVESIRNVAGMISDISAATHSQTRDIHDINAAVARLDEMTQQNSALVEESSAAADSLREQAVKLTEVVALFRVNGSTASTPHAPVPAPARAPAPRPTPRPATALPKAKAPAASPRAPAPKPAAALPAKSSPKPPAGDSGDWESF